MLICPKTIIKTKNLVFCKTVKMYKMNYEDHPRFEFEFKMANNFSEKKLFKRTFLLWNLKFVLLSLILITLSNVLCQRIASYTYNLKNRIDILLSLYQYM